jgi:hypothetical protein
MRECRRRRYADMRGQRDAGREGYSVVISRALQHHSSFMHTPVFAYIRQPVHTLVLVRAGERVGWRASERAVAYFAPECMQTTQISFSLSFVRGRPKACLGDQSLEEGISRYLG